MKTMSRRINRWVSGGLVLLFSLVPTSHAEVQTCVPPPSGLVSWWPGDGNANDVAGNNNGILINEATFASGVVAGAFFLNGVNQFIDAGNAPSLQVSAGDFTVDAWVNFDSVFPPPDVPLVGCGGLGCCLASGCDMSIVDKIAGVNVDGWRLIKQADNHFWFCFGIGGNGCIPGSPTTVISTTVVTPGVWYHIAGVKSSTGISIYVNGVLEDSKPPAAFVDTNAAALLIGSHAAAEGTFLNGLVDEVELYDRALTDTEIQTIFDAGTAGKCKMTTVTIDIKPGSFPNTINPRSKGKIPVAILTTGTFDATNVDASTVLFGPAGSEAAPVQSALEDIDGDGDTDMILHFNTQATGIQCGDSSASLTGETFSGQAIEGSDSINTAGCKSQVQLTR